MEKKLRKCIFFVLAVVIGLVYQVDSCCDNTAFILQDPSMSLCTNSFIIESNLGSQKGVTGQPSINPKWWTPNGQIISSSPFTGPVFAQSAKLKHSVTNGAAMLGIYTYTSSSIIIRRIGIYSSTNENIFVNVLPTLTVHDHFNQSALSLHLTCQIRNYPPTCLSWLKDNITIANTTTASILLNNITSFYSNSIQLYGDNVTKGNYSCSVASIGIVNKTNNSFVYIEGPPILLLSETQLISMDTLMLKWYHPLVTSPSSQAVYNIYYREIDNDTVITKTCHSRECNISQLETDGMYTFVIGRHNMSGFNFLPSKAYTITIAKPNAIDRNTIIHSITLPQRDSHTVSVNVQWNQSFLQYTTLLRYWSLCHVEECDSGTLMSVSNATNITGLIEGLDYNVSLVSVNGLGQSEETVITVYQMPKVPFGSLNTLRTTILNSSSFNISWESLSCCQSSGEIPSYMLTIDSTTDTYTANITLTTNWYTFTNLTEGTQYTISLSAFNSVGIGPTTSITISLPYPSSTVSFTNLLPSTQIATPPSIPPASSFPLLFLIIIIAVCLTLLVLCAVCCSVVVYCVIRACSDKKTRQSDDNNIFLAFNSPIYSHQEVTSPFDKCQQPYVIEFPTDTKAIEGESVHFLVRIGGTPSPSYQWTHQGEPLTSHDNIQIFSDGTLVIDSIKEEDGGQYTFNAHNNSGVLTRIVNLTVSSSEEEEEEMQWRQSVGSLNVEHNPVPLHALEKYVEVHHSSDNQPFMILYASLTSNKDKKVFHDRSHGNSKNRYKSILPYEDNAVKLKPLEGWKEFQGTYINASYIDGYNQRNKYIATQGPLPNTVGDFWRMIWKERSHTIVMLTNKIEGNRVKCEEYWPSLKNDLQIGPFVVRCNSEDMYANFTIRNFNIFLTDGTQSTHSVKQFHYTTWPDHGVPDHGSPLILFLQKVRRHHTAINERGPITVHCSAGVGRTGTFIALDIGLNQIKSENEIDFISIINHMRDQRRTMVQTINQFTFLYDTVLEQVLCGNTLIFVSKLYETLSRLDSFDEGSKKTNFEIQFQLIKRITPKLTTYKCDVGKEFVEKNRPGTPLPSDTRRVILKGTDCHYINASYIDGYQEKREFIITQSPLLQTLTDFWEMVSQHNSSTILMLCNLSENSKVVCCQYWPSGNDSATVYGHLSVKLINEVQESSTIKRRTLGIKNMNNGKCTTVTQLQVNSWLPDGQCANHSTIGDLYILVTDNQRRCGSNKPVIVHCSDTVTRSAMYCVVHNAIEQSKLEQAFDVFQTVKTLRMQRPGSIPTQQNYQTVHEVISSFLCNFATYNQFQDYPETNVT